MKSIQEIINGDCLKVMDSMKSNSVDVVCTSPPYNIGIKYNSYKDNLKYDDYLGWIAKVGQSIHRILKINGSLFMNVGRTNVNPFLSLDIACSLRNIFVLQNTIIWVKAISIDDNPANSFGHYKPINSNRYLNNLYEEVFHFTKDGSNKVDRLAVGVPYKWKSNLKSRSTGAIKEDMKCRGDIWFIPYKTINNKSERHYHPASFPVLLPERCIKLHCISKDMVVVDPFVGIGTTLVACHRLGIKGIGIDIDKHYCDIAQKTIFEEEHKSKLFDV